MLAIVKYILSRIRNILVKVPFLRGYEYFTKKTMHLPDGCVNQQMAKLYIYNTNKFKQFTCISPKR